MKALRVMQLSLKNLKHTKDTLSQELNHEEGLLIEKGKEMEEYRVKINRVEEEAARKESKMKQKVPDVFRSNIDFFKEISSADDPVIREEKIFEAFERKQRINFENAKRLSTIHIKLIGKEPAYEPNSSMQDVREDEIQKERNKREQTEDKESDKPSLIDHKEPKKEENSSASASDLLEVPRNFIESHDSSKEDIENKSDNNSEKVNEDQDKPLEDYSNVKEEAIAKEQQQKLGKDDTKHEVENKEVEENKEEDKKEHENELDKLRDKPKKLDLSLIHICRCRRYAVCRSRWSPYH
eukprot:TRINITY_DN4456_c0_g2_i4.p1 TRINITY_DN4456_c0_g2~~TRINITY_DN4456_c0_g2_i4.p1  ORF type:complete len:296 (+),score=75.74 TRINITY_DN4456_c0_g2_i4:346-1233(+)